MPAQQDAIAGIQCAAPAVLGNTLRLLTSANVGLTHCRTGLQQRACVLSRLRELRVACFHVRVQRTLSTARESRGGSECRQYRWQNECTEQKGSPFRCPLALASRPLVCPDYNILSAVLPHSPQKDPAAGPGILKNTNKSPIKKACAVKQTGPAQKKRVVRRAAPGGEVCAPLLFHLLLALAAD